MPTRVRYLVLASLCAVSALVYVQRQCLANAETVMRRELGFTVETMGFVLGAWLWTYAAFQIPGAKLGDVWGSQRALPLYCAVWSVTTILTAFVTWVPLLVALRFLFGAAHAGLFPCIALVIRHWMPVEKRGLSTGCVAAFQQLGAAGASQFAGWWLAIWLALSQPDWAASEKMTLPPLPSWVAALSGDSLDFLKAFFDWRNLFVWAALPGLIWSAWFSWWFRDRPSEHASVNEAELALMPRETPSSPQPPSAANPGSRGLCSLILTSPLMWLICGQQACRAFGYIFFQTWFPTFLVKTRGVSVSKSGSFTSLMFVAALLGALAGGVFSDWLLVRTQSRRVARQGLAILGLIGAAGFAIGAYFVESANAAVAVLACGSFCASLAGPSGYTVAIDVAGRHTTVVFATMNMAGNLGAAAFPILVPFLLKLPERLGASFSGWDLVLFVFGGIYLLSAVFWLGINPNRTIESKTA
ncbi:MAG: MFS transporter [Planctomycetaceae bacterium]|nr:MFS transporter [Planctomycetaceae bacterium]